MITTVINALYEKSEFVIRQLNMKKSESAIKVVKNEEK